MVLDITSSEQKLKNNPEIKKSTNSAFMMRVILVAIVAAIFISIGNVNIGAIGQGFSYALVGVAVFLTFRILDFPDLTIDGSFPIGGATCAVMILAGYSPEASMIVAFVAGALTGLVTAIIHVFFKIEGLLASIIVITGAYTITLRIMEGKSNIPLIGEVTIISRYGREFRAWLIEQFGEDMRRQSNNILEIVLFGVLVVVILSLLYWFFTDRNRLGTTGNR